MSESLVVLNKDEDTVSFIDESSGVTTDTVDTDFNPHETVTTIDGSKTFVTCSLGNRINVIDNDTREVVDVIDHEEFDFPHGMDVTADGERLYMTSTYSEKIYSINPETHEITNVVPTHQDWSHMITIDDASRTAYLANIGSDNVTVFDLEHEKTIDHFPVGGMPEGIRIHPDGRDLYVANQEDDNLYVVDTETYEVAHELDLGTTPIRIVFSPDGEYAFVPNRESDDLSIIRTSFPRDGDDQPWEVKRIPVGVWPGGTVFNEDGSRAYVANNKTNDISVVDTDELIEVTRFDAGIHPDGITYIAD